MFDNMVVLIGIIIHSFSNFINSIFSFTVFYGIISSIMPFSPHLPARVYDIIAKIKAVWGSFFQIMRQGAENVRVRVQPVIDRIAEKLPPGKPRLVAGVSIATFSLVLLIVIGASLAARGDRENRAPATAGITPVKQGFILPDELFLPSEPDFIPGVLLEREQRATWTTGDAAPLWQDPLKNGEEPWRNRIEKAIDEIMESVP
jgi:hypothetical protein